MMTSRCPYLGLHTERTITLNTPTSAHRCYVDTQSFNPDEGYQKSHCLCNNYSGCSRFVPLPSTALILTSASNPLLEHLPAVRSPEAPQAHRVLLPRRTLPGVQNIKPQEPRLLSGTTSFSATKIHRWSLFSTKLSLLATTLLLFLTFMLGLFWQSYRVLPLGRDYRASNIVALSSAGMSTAAVTSMPVTIIALGGKPTATPSSILAETTNQGASVKQRLQPVYALKPPATPTPENISTAHYITATPTPGNAATATAQTVIATAYVRVYGTQIALPTDVIIVNSTPIEAPTLSSITRPSNFTATTLLTQVVRLTLSATAEAIAPTRVTQTDAPPALILETFHNKILFKSSRDGGENVYALDPFTGIVRKVDHPELHALAYQNVARAPDGRSIAVVAPDVNSVLQIQIQSLEDNRLRVLTAFKGISYDPAWSPQGDQIAFVSTNNGDDEIYVISADGFILQQLTFNGNRWDKHPTWSPDGSQIVFYSNQETLRRQLWIMQADGSASHNLSNNEYEDWDPIWIP